MLQSKSLHRLNILQDVPVIHVSLLFKIRNFYRQLSLVSLQPPLAFVTIGCLSSSPPKCIPIGLPALCHSNYKRGKMDFYKDEEMYNLHWIFYRVTYSVIITITIPLQAITAYTLNKPELKKNPVNRYFLLMILSDFAMTICIIPSVISLNGCVFWSYSFAFYFAHFGWSLETLYQMLSVYILLWISVDRFMAAWNIPLFSRVYKDGVILKRMVATFIFCVFSHLQKFICAEVLCLEGNMTNCTEFKIRDDVHYKNNSFLPKFFMTLHEISLTWFPVIILAVLNFGLAIKLYSKNYQNSFTSDYRREKENRAIINLLCFSFTYIFISTPISWYIIFYQDLESKCYGSMADEIFRGVGNIFEVAQGLMHILYLYLLNKKFRMAIISFFKTKSADNSTQESQDKREPDTSTDTKLHSQLSIKSNNSSAQWHSSLDC
ncbi:uncharacterized protein LOC125045341 [Penaeus chinensis]|uniref:uncharacterized protein LOC125045341 n=1 Tax=Penaeus chinensis TaxID=139456 RepID=UPI001FB67197|nr:uncharacterized protein LOC125045341 [Penaeus chinensis]